MRKLRDELAIAYVGLSYVRQRREADVSPVGRLWLTATMAALAIATGLTDE